MRAGIRDNIKWENSGFVLAGEAPDGELAFSLMQEIMPDILIADVKMPFMDGIELARKAKKTMPWIKIVLLSGHDEFKYAKEAIAIGVEDYLLKPITSGKLMETLNQVAVRIEEEKEKLRNVEKLIEGTRKVQIERLLSDLLYGSIDVSKALDLAEELNLPVLSNYYLVMHIELHRCLDESDNYFYDASNCASGVLKGWENAVFLNQGADRIVCILKGSEPNALKEDSYTCAQAVKYEVERNGPCLVAVGIGSIVSSIEKWPKSLADADVSKRYLNLTNRNQIISIQDINGGIPFAEINKLPTIEKLRYASMADMPAFVEEFLNSFDSKSLSSFIFVNYVFLDILVAASKIIEELKGDAKVVLSEYSNISSLLNTNHSIENIEALLSSILGKVISFRDAAVGSKYNEVIIKAQQYIQEHYFEKDITLHSVAKEVSFSPNHFSTIFSQETGETFIAYVTKIRLEHAKTLLKTTNKRTSDIGYEVGYTDTHYFSYVFKKNVGMTPKEFKNS